MFLRSVKCAAVFLILFKYLKYFFTIHSKLIYAQSVFKFHIFYTYAPTCWIVIRPILVRTYHNSKTRWNTQPHDQLSLVYLGQNPRSALSTLLKAMGLHNVLTSLLTVNPSWTSVMETPCEANKISYPELSYFTWNASKYTIRDLEDWKVSIYTF